MAEPPDWDHHTNPGQPMQAPIPLSAAPAQPARTALITVICIMVVLGATVIALVAVLVLRDEAKTRVTLPPAGSSATTTAALADLPEGENPTRSPALIELLLNPVHSYKYTCDPQKHCIDEFGNRLLDAGQLEEPPKVTGPTLIGSPLELGNLRTILDSLDVDFTGANTVEVIGEIHIPGTARTPAAASVVLRREERYMLEQWLLIDGIWSSNTAWGMVHVPSRTLDQRQPTAALSAYDFDAIFADLAAQRQTIASVTFAQKQMNVIFDDGSRKEYRPEG